MNKLQLYITKSLGSYKDLFKINPSEEESRHIRELREEVQKVNYDSTEKNIFFYVTTIDTGTFITIIRTIPSAPVDHLAAWIYIPNELIIDAETLEGVVNTTMRKISGDKVTQEDVAKLRELFATEYMTDPNAPQMTASKSGNQMAWRGYNANTGVTLRDLLGKGLFQVPYLDYCGVMFVDRDLGLTVKGADLTNLRIEGPAVVLPAERTPENFVAHVFGHPANKPIRASLNANIAVVWQHPGFEEVIKEEVITTPEFEVSVPDTSMAKKEISRASFQIAATSGTAPLTNCKITVNGFEVSEKPHKFSTSELKSAAVLVNCEGYAPYNAKMDLARSTKALIRLKERTMVYNFEMPVKLADLGAPVRFQICSKRPITESPLEGYVCTQDEVLEGETRKNILSYSPKSTFATANKLVYVGAGLIVGLIFGWLTGCGGGSDKKAEDREEVLAVDTVQMVDVEATADAEAGLDSVTIALLKGMVEYTPKTAEIQSATNLVQQQQQAQAQAVEPPKDMNTVSEESIAYLDNNKTWTKEDLDKQPGLAGLYEDLNNFNLDALTTTWAEKLGKSKAFKEVVKFANQGNKPSKIDKCKAKGATFNTGGESSIKLQQYFFRIDP